MRRNTYIPLATSSALGVFLYLVSGLASAQQLYRIFDLAPGEQWTTVDALNASGQAAGIANYVLGVEPETFYVWSDGVSLRPGTLGGENMSVADINAAGQVTGYGRTEGEEDHAFVRDGHVLHDIGTLGGEWSEGLDINAAGQVTGYAMDANGAYRAFLWDGLSMKNLGTLGGVSSFGEAINASGKVAGTSLTTSNTSRAFLWDGAKMNDLGTLGGENSWATGINKADQVIGESVTANGESHAFLWNGTTMQDLGTLGGDQSTAVAINAAGHVTGWATTADFVGHPYLWDGSEMRDLGSLVGMHSFAQAINNVGQVVGSSRMRNGNSHAFLSNDGQPMVDLNDLIDRADPLKECVRLFFATDINDRGYIAANGEDQCVSTFRYGAYLVVPMNYMMVLNTPMPGSRWDRTSAITIKMTLVDATGTRISDARAASLIAAPCKVKFSASGTQPRPPVCMKYTTTTNQFYFDWIPGATANAGHSHA